MIPIVKLFALILAACIVPTFSAVDSPTNCPTTNPITSVPSYAPSVVPSSSAPSSSSPSSSIPTISPTQNPSTSSPSNTPSSFPSSSAPSNVPSTSAPTMTPSWVPTASPSEYPSGVPTSSLPTGIPTFLPTATPTFLPTTVPSSTPSSVPSAYPTSLPTSIPTSPTSNPSGIPSATPTSSAPTSEPSTVPSSVPSANPTAPTSLPSSSPSYCPSGKPSNIPTGQPTTLPSAVPTVQPSEQPTSQPTGQPSGQPTGQPTGQPSSVPSGVPSGQPTSVPTSIPTAAPTSYNGTECTGVIDYQLFSTTPFDECEANVSKLMDYQAPVWIEYSCKSHMRQYACSLIYQPYGVWYNPTTGERENRRYCDRFCDFILEACEDYFNLADDIDLKYKDKSQYEEYSTDPETFVHETCLMGTRNSTYGTVCYLPSASAVQEVSAQCPDPAVVPNDKTLSSQESVYVPRFEGSECAIACPNHWYRKGTFYLNSFILYIVSGLSCVLGIVTLCQHAHVIYQARVYARGEVTVSLMAARKKTVLSEQVVMLCLGVSVSNTASVLFMMVNNLSHGHQNHPLQCEGNSGFLQHNSLCAIQGALLIFSICWQQAWTGRICSHIFGIIRPYDKLARFFHTRIFKILQGYFCFVHPVFCVIVFMSLKYVGNYWKSEYNFCGPSFGKSENGDLCFLLLIWLPIMVLGPIYVLCCTSFVIKSVQHDIRPSMSGVSTDRFEDRSTEEDISIRGTNASLVSVDFGSEGGMGDVRLSEFGGGRRSSLHPSEGSSPLPRLTRGTEVNRKLSTSRPKFVQTFLNLMRSCYVYRRIVFLIFSSVIALIAAYIIATTAISIDRYSQNDFYDCMLRESAYNVNNANSGECGGQARRIEVSWRIFVVQIFMISFGIGPFFAFGTESVRGGVRRVSVFFAGIVGKYLGATFINARAWLRRVTNRPVNEEVRKAQQHNTSSSSSAAARDTVQTDRMATLSEDMASISSPMAPTGNAGYPTLNDDADIGVGCGEDEVKYNEDETQDTEGRPRAETDMFSDVLSGDIRLSDFMQQGGASFENEYEYDDFQ